MPRTRHFGKGLDDQAAGQDLAAALHDLERRAQFGYLGTYGVQLTAQGFEFAAGVDARLNRGRSHRTAQ